MYVECYSVQTVLPLAMLYSAVNKDCITGNTSKYQSRHTSKVTERRRVFSAGVQGLQQYNGSYY